MRTQLPALSISLVLLVAGTASAQPSASWLAFPAQTVVGVPQTLSTVDGTQVDVTITTGGPKRALRYAADTLGIAATGLAYDTLRAVAIDNSPGSGAVLTTLTFANIHVGPAHGHGLFMLGALNGGSAPVTVTSSVPGRVATFTTVGSTFPIGTSNSFAITWQPATGKFLTSAPIGNDSRGIVIDLGDLRNEDTLRVSLNQLLNDGVLFGFGETTVDPLSVTPAPPTGRASLSPPRPNPAREESRFDFALGSPGHVRLEVLDVSGRRLAGLDDDDFVAGSHSVRWDLRRDDGSRVAPGLVFVSLRTGEGTRVRRLVVSR